MRDFMLESIRPAQSSFIRTNGWEDRGRELSADAIEARKAYEAKHRWTPGPLEVNQMIHAIRPKDAGRPIEAPRVAPGITKKRVPMTYEAQQVVREIHERQLEAPPLDLRPDRPIAEGLSSAGRGKANGICRATWR